MVDQQNLFQIGPGISEEMWWQTYKHTHTHTHTTLYKYIDYPSSYEFSEFMFIARLYVITWEWVNIIVFSQVSHISTVNSLFIEVQGTVFSFEIT